jgi:hypothetical protein
MLCDHALFASMHEALGNGSDAEPRWLDEATNHGVVALGHSFELP